MKISKERQKLIERKYGRKVKRIYNLYKDKTWGELWEALDLLKEEMKKEMTEYESQ